MSLARAKSAYNQQMALANMLRQQGQQPVRSHAGGIGNILANFTSAYLGGKAAKKYDDAQLASEQRTADANAEFLRAITPGGPDYGAGEPPEVAQLLNSGWRREVLDRHSPMINAAREGTGTPLLDAGYKPGPEQYLAAMLNPDIGAPQRQVAAMLYERSLPKPIKTTLKSVRPEDDLYQFKNGVATRIKEGKSVSGNAELLTGAHLSEITGIKLPPNALFQKLTSKNGTVKYAPLHTPPNATKPIQTGQSLNENIVFTGNDGGVYPVYTNVDANNRKTQFVMIGDEKVSMAKATKIGQFTKRRLTEVNDRTTNRFAKYNGKNYPIFTIGKADVIKLGGKPVAVSDLAGVEVFPGAAKDSSEAEKKAVAKVTNEVASLRGARKRLGQIIKDPKAFLGAKAGLVSALNEVRGIVGDFVPRLGDLLEASTDFVASDEQKQAVRELELVSEELYTILASAKRRAKGGRLIKDEITPLRNLTNLTGLTSKAQIVTRIGLIDDLLVEQLALAESKQEIITGESSSAANVEANSTAFSTSAVPKPDDILQKEWDKMTDNEKSFFEVKR